MIDPPANLSDPWYEQITRNFIFTAQAILFCMLPALCAMSAVFFVVFFIVGAIGVLYDKIIKTGEEKDKNNKEAVALNMKATLENRAKMERLELEIRVLEEMLDEKKCDLEMLKGDSRIEKGGEKEKEKEDGDDGSS